MKKIILILLLSFCIPSPIMKSLILPGWGELSIGNKKRAKIFLYTESILVISAYSFNSLSNIYKSDYIAYAKIHADVNLDNEDYMFALDIGSNDNIKDFNDIKERSRSLMMRLDSNGEIIRESNHEIYPEGIQYDWNWDSNSNRQNFNSMRIKSINYEKYIGFVFAGMIINRVVSLIDIMVLDKKTNTSISSVVIPKGYDGLEFQLYIKF